MKKQYILLAALFGSTLSFAQVGVNTETPQATLDVAGKPTDTSVLDGVIPPRLSGAQLRAKTYTTTQTGALVYVNLPDTAPAGQTIDVTSTGYYYFDGVKWIKMSSATGSTNEVDGVIGNEVLDATANGGLIRSGTGTSASPFTLGLTNGSATGDVMTWNNSASTWSPAVANNIYNVNGTLIGNRLVTQDNKTLTFSNIQNTTFSNTAGVGILQDSGSGTRSSIGLYNGGANQLILFSDTGSATQIMGTGSTTSLNIGTTSNTVGAPVTFLTSSGSNAGGTEKMRINPNGNVGIATSAPTEKLDNAGITRLRSLPTNGATNAINTTSTGAPSSTQNQTFNATRTVVADANGVLGYVDGLPSVSANTGTSQFQIGEIRSARVIVPAATFIANGGSRNVMTGRSTAGTTDRRSGYEILLAASDAAQTAKYIMVNGLRMDFIESGGNTSVSAKLFNTTGATVEYNLAGLSTNDQNTSFGNNMLINANHFSYNIDGNDDMTAEVNGRIEYVNTMLTFPNGQWYNCTWHATRDANNYYFYTTAQRLN